MITLPLATTIADGIYDIKHLDSGNFLGSTAILLRDTFPGCQPVLEEESGVRTKVRYPVHRLALAFLTISPPSGKSPESEQDSQ